MKTERIEYDDNGLTLEAHVAYPEGEGKRPLVLVSHAWAGRDKFEDDKAEALAELGYVGFALDLYGKGVLGGSVEENTALMTPLLEDRALLRRRITVALNRACRLEGVDASRVGAIGFCFGGLCVLDLARSGADVKGVVSFHGLFNSAENLPNQPIKAKVLALHGQEDPMVPPEMVSALQKELSEAGVDWQVHAYGNTYHAFTNPQANDPEMGTVYNADADRRSWIAMKNFFAEIL